MSKQTDKEFVEEIINDLEMIKGKIYESNKMYFISVGKLIESVQNNIINRLSESITIKSLKDNGEKYYD